MVAMREREVPSDNIFIDKQSGKDFNRPNYKKMVKASRFNKYIQFDNYSADEMFEIFRRLCEKMQYLLSAEAEEKALQYFADNQDDPTFGNARGVRNFFDKVVTNQATRILTIQNPSDSEFKTIKSEDIY